MRCFSDFENNIEFVRYSGNMRNFACYEFTLIISSFSLVRFVHGNGYYKINMFRNKVFFYKLRNSECKGIRSVSSLILEGKNCRRYIFIINADRHAEIAVLNIKGFFKKIYIFTAFLTEIVRISYKITAYRTAWRINQIQNEPDIFINHQFFSLSDRVGDCL